MGCAVTQEKLFKETHYKVKKHFNSHSGVGAFLAHGRSISERIWTRILQHDHKFKESLLVMAPV
jgi:hypothetical protein